MSTIEQALAKKQADLANKAKEESVDKSPAKQKATKKRSKPATTAAREKAEPKPEAKEVETVAVANDTEQVEETVATATPEPEITEPVVVKADEVEEVETMRATDPDPVVGEDVLELDLPMLENLGYLTAQDNSHNHRVQEEFREIKRNLLGNALTSKANNIKHPNLIMVSSALADEGKTFIAINLALSIAAEQDKTVLLVDADIYKPSVLRHCGIKPRKGLIEYLLGNIDEAGDIIYSTNVDKLKILPTGTPHYLANELLASAKMTSLVEELASRYPDRIVIFDCPPILGLTETAALSQLMGQAIIAVEENKTSIQKVNRACAMLNEDLAKGLVLNKALQSHKDLYGTNSYGYDNKTIL